MPAWLGSSYRVVAPHLDIGPTDQVIWQCGEATCELRTDLAIKHGDESHLALPAPHLTQELPATVQWKYLFLVR